MEDYIRFKRKNGKLFTWPCKLYIPVSLPTKNSFCEVARQARLSQAEFGAVIVMHYLSNRDLCEAAIAEYQRVTHEGRQEFLETEKKKAEEPFDRSFGGLFKSSFPESE